VTSEQASNGGSRNTRSQSNGSFLVILNLPILSILFLKNLVNLSTMTGRTHDLAAVTALGVIVLVQPARSVTLATAIIAIFANLIGGITPDIDQPTAPLWKNLPVGHFFGTIFDKMAGGHRFLTHSILGMIIFGLGSRWLLIFLHPIMHNVDISLVWWSFMIGMLSHLIMDTFTKEGVPWLLPIPIKFGVPPIKEFRITTGKAIETWVVFPALLVFNAYWYYSHSSQLLSILRHHIT
jgi:inner membrane protein